MFLGRYDSGVGSLEERIVTESVKSIDYVRANRFLLLLLGIGLAAATYINFGINEFTLSRYGWGRPMGETLGMAFALTLVPAIVIVPWRVIQRRSGEITNTPLIIGFFLFVISLFLGINGAMHEKSLAQSRKVTYAPPRCEFQVMFPGSPEITSVALGGLNWEQANVYTARAMFRAECAPMAILFLGDASQHRLRRFLERWAINNGLSDVHVSVDDSVTGLNVRGRLLGEKHVSGRRARYDLRVTVGLFTFMALISASPQKDFPRETAAFFSSLKQTDISSAASHQKK